MNYVLNGKVTSVASEWLDESLLFTLREYHGLVGAKFGCGVGICGACTVIIDDVATRSCQIRTGDLTATTCRNAAIASPGRSCPQLRS